MGLFPDSSEAKSTMLEVTNKQTKKKLYKSALEEINARRLYPGASYCCLHCPPFLLFLRSESRLDISLFCAWTTPRSPSSQYPSSSPATTSTRNLTRSKTKEMWGKDENTFSSHFFRWQVLNTAHKLTRQQKCGCFCFNTRQNAKKTYVKNFSNKREDVVCHVMMRSSKTVTEQVGKASVMLKAALIENLWMMLRSNQFCIHKSCAKSCTLSCFSHLT